MSRFITHFAARVTVGSIGVLGIALLGGCEPGHKQTTQVGYRGAGLDQIVDVRHMVKTAAIPPAPYPLPADGGPKASESYKNVQVLGGVSTERFNHLMAEINQWIAPPEQGCNYCHNPENMASDEKYTKVVARKMLQMTQNINSKWSAHVKQVGVTCYTCHRGNAVPANKWANLPDTPHPNSILGNKFGQNTPNPEVAYASLPSNMYADYLNGGNNIRVASDDEHPSANHVVSIKTAEKTYGLMMHLSTALGVNCTYCHNTQSFRAWNLSRPQRATAWYGIRMVRDTNVNYIGTLQSVFPAYRKGPQGDPYKVNCTTCHQGQSKPLAGQSMMDQAPALWGPTPASMPAPAAAPAARPQEDPAASTGAGPVPLAYNVAPAMIGHK
ncbi:photosynthetic reaction center cytochrome PufC [Novosphingobium sp.]|uniref:photosynthetic reaction center cytochrome PufC n=1 Tax=Novosphingobium sp. TaxID=1874826 RepID=UPI00333EEE08